MLSSAGLSPPKKAISFYPALLSEVSAQFQTLIQVSIHHKDSLEYTDCFQGKQGNIYLT